MGFVLSCLRGERVFVSRHTCRPPETEPRGRRPISRRQSHEDTKTRRTCCTRWASCFRAFVANESSCHVIPVGRRKRNRAAGDRSVGDKATKTRRHEERVVQDGLRAFVPSWRTSLRVTSYLSAAGNGTARPATDQ